ncbi:MAG TPA: hypothetical protein VKY74_18670 [Chloroflexia bacterium]|nr:hypothetical protein [Chloroflexia bacterium]
MGYLERYQLQRVEAEIGVLPLALHVYYQRVGAVDFTGSHPQFSMDADLDQPDWNDPEVIVQLETPDFQEPMWRWGRKEFYSDALVIDSLEELRASYEYGVKPDEPLDLPGRFVSLAPDFVFKAGCSGGGPYCLEVPNTAIDGLVFGLGPWYQQDAQGRVLLRDWPDAGFTAIDFVEYLRINMRWGGFPGLAEHADQPPAFLAALTHDRAEG